MIKIFLNFRNGDDNYAAALLYDTLATRFGADRVFRSTDSMRPGDNFPATLLSALQQCRIVLVVIGSRWLGSTDAQGRRRLWQKTDWVRREIALALSEGKEIIPVLLHDLSRLRSDQLPPSIRGLALLQSTKIDHRQLRAGLVALVDELVRRVPALAVERASPSPTTRLPVRPWGAIGRTELLDQVTAAISDGGTVVLCGRAGAGKTHLAAEYAHQGVQEHHTTWWVSAERPELITEQLGELARAAGVDSRAELQQLCRELGRRGRWLLILDGVAEARTVAGVLSSGLDRVLITSRDRRWAPPTVLVDVPGFARADSVRLLTEQVDGLSPAEADDLAGALDDLPLGVAQAATFLQGSTIDGRRYRELLDTRTSAVLDRGISPTYPRSLASVWSLALDALEHAQPAAGELARVCAVCAATPIPVDLFVAAPPELSLRSVAADPLGLDDMAAAVARSGLVEIRRSQLRPHRLFQRFLRDRMGADETERIRAAARVMIAAWHPGDPRLPDSWARYGILLPHILALDLVHATDPHCHWLLLDASHYLVVLGDADTARDLVTAALAHWTTVLGELHETVLAATSHLARAYFRLGDYRCAAELDERVLARRRRELGPHHPDTLAAAHDVAADASALSRQDSRRMHEELVRRRRVILGADHPDTLRSTHNLAVYLRSAGLPQEALPLDQDTYPRFRRILGTDHPDTLRSAQGLAVDLRLLDRSPEARALNEDTLARFRRVLGTDHIETLRCANNLVQDLHAVGAHSEADLLDRDNHTRLQRLGR